MSEDNYASTIEIENLNRQQDGVEVRGVEAALEALAVVGASDAAADRHPEKCVCLGLRVQCRHPGCQPENLLRQGRMLALSRVAGCHATAVLGW